MSDFATVAAEVQKNLVQKFRFSTDENDAEFQRVHSAIADVLKDAHMMYSKLVRLQGDFRGQEQDRLVQISEAVLSIGDELSSFDKSFYDGKLKMVQNDFTYGGDPSQGQAPPQAPPPAAPGGDAPPPPVPFGQAPEEAGEEPDEDYSEEQEQETQTQQ